MIVETVFLVPPRYWTIANLYGAWSLTGDKLDEKKVRTAHKEDLMPTLWASGDIEIELFDSRQPQSSAIVFPKVYCSMEKLFCCRLWAKNGTSENIESFFCLPGGVREIT